MTRSSAAVPGGTLVLDSEGLTKAVLRDCMVTGWLALARADDLRVITSAATLVEVVHPGSTGRRWSGRCPVSSSSPSPTPTPSTPPLSWPTPALHGHKYAIDAMLTSTALAAPGPATVLTSDPEDITALCGGHVTVIKI